MDLNTLLKNPMKFVKDINTLKETVNVLDVENLQMESSMPSDKLKLLNQIIPTIEIKRENFANELDVMLGLSGANKTRRDLENLTGKFIYLLSKHMWCLYLTDKLPYESLKAFYMNLFGINLDEKYFKIKERKFIESIDNLVYVFDIGNSYNHGYGYPGYGYPGYGYPGYGYPGYGKLNINDIQIKNKFFDPKYLDQLDIKNKSDKSAFPLKGIDKVLIIDLKGSLREAHMRKELAKIGLDTANEGKVWDFVRPLNIGINDTTIKEVDVGSTTGFVIPNFIFLFS